MAFRGQVVDDQSLHLIRRLSAPFPFSLVLPLDGHDNGKQEEASLFTLWSLALAILLLAEGQWTKVTMQGSHIKHSDLTAKSIFQKVPPDRVTFMNFWSGKPDAVCHLLG